MPSFQCANCGAQLHPAEHAETATCEFCGAITPLVEPAIAAPSPARGREYEAKVAAAARPAWTKRSWLGAWPLLIPIVIGGGLLFENLGLGRNVSITHVPIIADVTGDGHEDTIVQWTDGLAGGRRCVTGLIDGVSREVRWSTKTQTYCGASDAFGLAGNILVVGAKQPPSVSLYAMPSGALLGRVDLDAPPTGLVAHGDQVWIDMNSLPAEALVDLKAQRVTSTWTTTNYKPVQRPDWVAAPGQYNAPSTCSPSPCWDAYLQHAFPPVPDLRASGVRTVDGSDTAIVIGTKARGTPKPMIAAFSLSANTVLWTHQFESPTAADNTAFTVRVTPSTVYVRASSSLVALGSTNGEVLWNVGIGGHHGTNYNLDLVAGAYLYVPLDNGIEVRDLRSGDLVERVP